VTEQSKPTNKLAGVITTRNKLFIRLIFCNGFETDRYFVSISWSRKRLFHAETHKTMTRSVTETYNNKQKDIDRPEKNSKA